MTLSTKKGASAILELLRARYPHPESALNWRSDWELLVATVLAAQCTDARVNLVTPALFRRWPSPVELAKADLATLETVIYSTHFFRQKAKHLIAAAQRIMENYGGEVPRTMDALLTLPGVARKTANIVLSNAFGLHEGVAVDTHVRRIACRLGLTSSKDSRVIEKDLMPLFPREDWGLLNHCLVLFGREVCAARRPACVACPLEKHCPKVGVY